MGSISPEAEAEKLLVKIIEEKAKWTPNHTFVRFPGEDWETKGYSTITWRQYANGINKVAHWLDEQLGKSENNDTVAYMGPNDVRYAFVWPALNRTYRKCLLADDRITKPGLSSLLKATDCKVWLYAQDDPSNLEELGIRETSAKPLAFPSLEWCIYADGTPDYPYNKTWEEAKWDDILIINTSGTTGMPKPVFTNNGYWACQGANRVMSRRHWPRGFLFDPQVGKTVLTACLPKWGGGVTTIIGGPVYWDCVTVLPPPDEYNLSPDLFKKILSMNQIQNFWSAPYTLVGLYKDPSTQSLLKTLDCIVFIGASLDRAVGDDLSMHTRLLPCMTSTETGCRYLMFPMDRKLWHTVEYAPDGPHQFIKREGTGAAGDGSDDLYELVFPRPADGRLAEGRPTLSLSAWWNPAHNDLDVIETRELYSPVQDLGGNTRWLYRARTDDMTKLSWLAMFKAEQIEAIILRHPDVDHVLVGGQGRSVPFVIIQPKDGAREGKTEDELLTDIYDDAVAQANKAGVGEIRIPRETVLLSKKEKPFKVSMKGLVARKEVEKEYGEEIDQAYDMYKKGTGNGGTQ